MQGEFSRVGAALTLLTVVCFAVSTPVTAERVTAVFDVTDFAGYNISYANGTAVEYDLYYEEGIAYSSYPGVKFQRMSGIFNGSTEISFYEANAPVSINATRDAADAVELIGATKVAAGGNMVVAGNPGYYAVGDNLARALIVPMGDRSKLVIMQIPGAHDDINTVLARLRFEAR